ncbi:MAG: hypothetical protein F9K15_22805 [Zoogloea sp.]|nr:MAG: hypothetical protein F9K15_22805 [Zoogloea sp.]
MMTNESRQCSAKTHGTGEPCRNLSHFPSGRCRLHGGASTGPKTDMGKARAGLNGRLGGRPHKLHLPTSPAGESG